jgi:N-acyl homoserine lactone hydrolase
MTLVTSGEEFQMNTWKIKVLYLGKITMQFSTMLNVCYAFGAPRITDDFTISAPYLGFLLQNGNHNIVVDNGISSKFIVDGRAWAGLLAEGGESFILKALSACKIAPQDIETVIYTHLHNDHAGNCGTFKNATHIFQEDEWQNLIEPLPIQNVRKDYDPDVIDELKSLKCYHINGDIEPLTGIRILKTPGHTRGSQSVAVDTEKGTVVLVGDMLTSYIGAFPETTEIIDLEGNPHKIPPAPSVFGDAIPSNVTYDFYAFYSSVRKVKAAASQNKPGFIIPGHETSLVTTGI